MGKIPSDKYLKKNKVHPGPHPLCYRCDAHVKDFNSDCDICKKTDQIANCVREWCELCKENVPKANG